jgi:hypothetical protein
MIYVEPSKGQMISFGIKGTNLVAYLHCLRVYESICKEYITAQAIVYDDNNVVENMGIVPGDPASFEFKAPPNDYVYSAGKGGGYGDIQVLKMKGEQAPGTLKFQIYTIDFIGPVYYQDRNTTVFDDAYAMATGTDHVQRIWNQYLNKDTLHILTPSSGMIGDTDDPHTGGGDHPLTAIKNILKETVSAQSKDTGSWVIFKNRFGVNVEQVAQLFAGIAGAAGSGTFGGAPLSSDLTAHGQQEYFLQKETWGVRFQDAHLYHAIIFAQVEAREGTGSGGRGSGVNISGAGQMTQGVYDMAMGNIVPQGLISSAPSGMSNFFSSVSSAAGGGGFGPALAGLQITNSKIFPNATAPFTKTSGEQSYSAACKDSPGLVLQVPMQTGLNVTVGRGLWAQLVPPIGIGAGAGNINTYLLNGPWLVTDLVQEIYTDERERQATSTFQCLKGAKL